VAIPEPPTVSPAAVTVASNLRVDGATAEVLRAFGAAGIQSILLKGPSVVRWLYGPDDPRPYIDSDLLVRPADVAMAEQVLADLGFEPEVDEREMAILRIYHAVHWQRRQDGVIVDLHRALPGVGVDHDRLWLTLSANLERLVVGGSPADTLTAPGRAFHLAIHAAHHGVGWEKVVVELERALSHADESTWRAAAELAAELGATAEFATGLRMVPAGRTLASALSLPTAAPVDVVLRAGTPPPTAVGFDQLVRAEGWLARLRILARKVVPPPTYLRVWSPLARRGRLGLALAYAWRPLWILRSAPAGLRAWQAARRRARI
jgi:hypothetical protein